MLYEVITRIAVVFDIGGANQRVVLQVGYDKHHPPISVLQSSQNIQRRLSPELEPNRQAAGALGLDLELVYRYLEERGIIDFRITSYNVCYTKLLRASRCRHPGRGNHRQREPPCFPCGPGARLAARNGGVKETVVRRNFRNGSDARNNFV